jgi:hypothetical protein
MCPALEQKVRKRVKLVITLHIGVMAFGMGLKPVWTAPPERFPPRAIHNNATELRQSA